MKTKYSALALLLSVSLASAQTVPNLLSYQGRVTDASGVLIGNSAPVNRAVTFRVYSASSGGSALYAETQTATISGGEFSVLIGNGTGVSGSPGPSAPATTPFRNLNDTLNSTAYQSLYLGITVDDGVPSTVDAEISPRQQLVSGAFAFRAGVAQAVVSGAVNTAMIGDSQISTNKVAASAITSAKIADANITNAKLADSTITATKLDTTSIGVWTPSGNNVYRSAGNVGIGQTNPGFPLNFANTAGDKISLFGNSGSHYGFGIGNNLLRIHADHSASDVAFGYGSSASFTETMRVKGNGNVGIGTAVPVAKLDVNGTGRFGNDTAKIGNTDVGFFGDSFNIGLRAPNNGATFIQSAGGAYTYMHIANNGNVGIRNINARSALQVTGVIQAHDASVGPDNSFNGVICTTRPSTANQHINMTRAGNAVWSLGFVPNSNTFGIGGGSPTDSSFNPNFKLTTDGKVQIGTVGNAGRLNVGTVPHSYFSSGHLNTNGATGSNNDRVNENVSIVADGHILSSMFETISDKRVKTALHHSDSHADLGTLLGIEITDYKYIDTVANGNGLHKKVIAQQVETVFPQAVRIGVNTVPDIYQNSTEENGWVQLATDLKPGEHVRLIGENEESTEEVLEVRDGAFRTSYKPAEGKLFVYGRQVPDFRTVDYDAIAMLNVSATQELAKKVEEKESRIAELEARLTALEKLIQAGN